MKIDTKLTKVGNSMGVRIPQEWIRRLGLDSGITIEERVGEIVVAPKNAPKKLSWEETASEMAADDEDWSDWERMPDGWSPE